MTQIDKRDYSFGQIDLIARNNCNETGHKVYSPQERRNENPNHLMQCQNCRIFFDDKFARTYGLKYEIIPLENLEEAQTKLLALPIR